MAIPSNEEQLTLELINRIRADPTGEYNRLQITTNTDIANAVSFFNVDLPKLQSELGALSAVAPVAWSDALNQAAQTHTDLLKSQDAQSHQLPGEASLGGRITAAGYNWTAIGENVFSYAKSMDHAHAGFVIDWGNEPDGMQTGRGHRASIMNGNFVEVGVGHATDSDPSTSVGPHLITHNFGASSGYSPQFLGVVINDADNDSFYDIGEGLGGVTISLSGAAGNFSTTSWASGGWQISVPAGSYQVTFSGGGLTSNIVKSATLGADNVKLDAISSGAATGGATEGNDVLVGTPGDDTIDGLGGNDTITGLAGFDTLVGGPGDDRLDGGSNPTTQGDILLGGLGNDTYLVDSALDLVDEGIVFGGAAGGTDEIISTADFFWDFYSAGDILRIAEGADDPGNDGTTGVGSVFSNTMIGNSGTNVLFGRGGADTYRAGDGIDFMSLSLLGLTEANAYAGVDGVNTVIVEQRTTGLNSYDIIFEFEAGKDKVNVADYASVNGLSSGADVVARAVDDGIGNSYIALGDGLDYVYMVGLEKADLQAGDFIV